MERRYSKAYQQRISALASAEAKKREHTRHWIIEYGQIPSLTRRWARELAVALSTSDDEQLKSEVKSILSEMAQCGVVNAEQLTISELEKAAPLNPDVKAILDSLPQRYFVQCVLFGFSRKNPVDLPNRGEPEMRLFNAAPSLAVSGDRTSTCRLLYDSSALGLNSGGGQSVPWGGPQRVLKTGQWIDVDVTRQPDDAIVVSATLRTVFGQYEGPEGPVAFPDDYAQWRHFEESQTVKRIISLDAPATFVWSRTDEGEPRQWGQITVQAVQRGDRVVEEHIRGPDRSVSKSDTEHGMTVIRLNPPPRPKKKPQPRQETPQPMAG